MFNYKININSCKVFEYKYFLTNRSNYNIIKNIFRNGYFVFNFKKPLAFITGIICSTVCLHHCSALERNELGIITALTKDATIEEKIGEACLAYAEYAKRLNDDPDLVEDLMYKPYGTVISYNTNDTDINTDYYDEIVKGNFGLKWVVMHYIARLLNEAGIRAGLWCFYDGMFVPSASANSKDILKLLYHCLVVYWPTGETLHTFDFNINNNNKLDIEPRGISVFTAYSCLIDAFKKDGVENITMTCTDPKNRKYKPLPPEIKQAANYARAMYDQPNIDKKSYENVFYVSQKEKIKCF